MFTGSKNRACDGESKHRPVTRGGSGGSDEPPFSRTPLQKILTPPSHLKRFDSMSDIVFQVGLCLTPANLLRFSVHDQLSRHLLSALRTPFSTLSDHPNRSNRLNLPKITNTLLLENRLEHRRYFAAAEKR